MPELPEVEITRRGIERFLTGNIITGVTVRNRNLRWPVPRGIEKQLAGSRIARVARRGKYILVECNEGARQLRGGSARKGWLILHLGMSGSLRIVDSAAQPQKHDHFDLVIGGRAMRLRDPRRFGAVLWESGEIEHHPLLAGLGAEPLEASFTGDALHAATRGRKVAIKLLLMNAGVVVGIGNIYANESLFHAGISPRAQAGRLSLARCTALVAAIKTTLGRALAAGGSSLRDFVHSDGASGYFQQQYRVYDRAGRPCRACGTAVRAIRQGQRSTFYCPACQN